MQQRMHKKGCCFQASYTCSSVYCQAYKSNSNKDAGLIFVCPHLAQRGRMAGNTATEILQVILLNNSAVGSPDSGLYLQSCCIFLSREKKKKKKVEIQSSATARRRNKLITRNKKEKFSTMLVHLFILAIGWMVFHQRLCWDSPPRITLHGTACSGLGAPATPFFFLFFFFLGTINNYQGTRSTLPSPAPPAVDRTHAAVIPAGIESELWAALCLL